jgi:antitoxin HigA-1
MKQRIPTHPGEILKEDVFPALGLKAVRAAEILDISRQYMSDILNARKPLTPLLCLKIARLVGNDAAMWMNLQTRYTLWETMNNKQAMRAVDKIVPAHDWTGA